MSIPITSHHILVLAEELQYIGGFDPDIDRSALIRLARTPDTETDEPHHSPFSGSASPLDLCRLLDRPKR